MAFYKKFTPDREKQFGSYSRGKNDRFRREDEAEENKRGYSSSRSEKSAYSKGKSSAYSSFRSSSNDWKKKSFGERDRHEGERGPSRQFDRFARPAQKRATGPFRQQDSSSRRGFGPERQKQESRFIPKSQEFQPVSASTESVNGPVALELPENLLSGRNPIREALKAGRDIEKLMVAEGDLSGSAREIVSLAKNAGIIVQTVERSRLDQITRNHQGMIAFASAFSYSSVDAILDTAKERNEEPFIVILDKITDPMNLGAIIRSAACVGAHGVIVQQHRAVGLTPSAVRASAGAVEHVKVARVTNINQTIRQLKELGIWVYAADAEGTDYRTVDFKGGCALVIGSEGEGISKLTLDLCDQTVSIPMSGVIDSLNASVAAGILMYGVYTGRSKQSGVQ